MQQSRKSARAELAVEREAKPNSPVLNVAGSGQSVADDHRVIHAARSVTASQPLLSCSCSVALVACSTTHRSLSLPQVRKPTETLRRTTPLSNVYSEMTAMDCEGIKFEKRFLATAGGAPGGCIATVKNADQSQQLAGPQLSLLVGCEAAILQGGERNGRERARAEAREGVISDNLVGRDLRDQAASGLISLSLRRLSPNGCHSLTSTPSASTLGAE